MPFIDAKITLSLTDAEKETLKTELGKTMSLLGKSETYLMVGIEDNYTLFMGGKRLEKGAYVEFSLLGDSTSENYKKVTKAICDMFEDVLSIPKDCVYITYHPIKDWGWKVTNF